jgi:hypothetical protein
MPNGFGFEFPDWGPEVLDIATEALRPAGGLTLDLSGLNALSPAAAVDRATPGGWLDWLSQMASRIERPLGVGLSVLGGLTTGAMALQSARQQRMLEQLQRASMRSMEQAREAAAPAQTAAAALVPAGQQALLGGGLPGPLEAQAEEWYRSVVARLRDALARSGLDESTAMEQAEAWARAQLPQIRAQLAGQLLTSGLGATQAAAGAIGTGAGVARGLEPSITGQLASTDELIRRAQQVLASYA